jgi:hypothetical protein
VAIRHGDIDTASRPTRAPSVGGNPAYDTAGTARGRTRMAWSRRMWVEGTSGSNRAIHAVARANLAKAKVVT